MSILMRFFFFFTLFPLVFQEVGAAFLWAEQRHHWRGRGNVLQGPTGKRSGNITRGLKKHSAKPEKPGSRRQTPPCDQCLLERQTTAISPGAAGALFWFLSRPGTVAMSDSLIGSWLTLVSFFLSSYTFFSLLFNEFPLVFPDTVRGWNGGGVIVSKFPGPVQGQEEEAVVLE